MFIYCSTGNPVFKKNWQEEDVFAEKTYKRFDISTNMTVKRSKNYTQRNPSISIHWRKKKKEEGLKEAVPVSQCCTPHFTGADLLGLCPRTW